MNSVQAVRTIRSRKTAVNYSKSGDVPNGLDTRRRKLFYKNKSGVEFWVKVSLHPCRDQVK